MTNTEAVLDYLKENSQKAICDDCLSKKLDINPRQQINLINNGLLNRKLIFRQESACSYCMKNKLVNSYDSGTKVNPVETKHPSLSRAKGAPDRENRRIRRKEGNGAPRMSKKPQLIDILIKSRQVFFRFLEECNRSYREGHDLSKYREIIARHRQTNDLETLLEDDSFLELLYETLGKWDMDKRGAKLTSFENFRRSVNKQKRLLCDLSAYRLVELTEGQKIQVLRTLERLFRSLEVMKTRRRIVGVSKALHFLVPDLVMPIDSTYTMLYFYGYNKYSNEADKEFEVYKDIFNKSFRITRKLDLSPGDASGDKWNTCVPKLIDNAMIGFEMYIKGRSFEQIMSSLGDLTSLTKEEESLIKKRTDKIYKEIREQVREKLLLKKAKEAGIEVTDEEVDAAMARNKKEKSKN
jgi:hypothetical protein